MSALLDKACANRRILLEHGLPKVLRYSASFLHNLTCLAKLGILLQEMAERERQRRELQKLTVSEILGLLKGRRIPIGANKRKDELIDRLLVGLCKLLSPAANFP